MTNPEVRKEPLAIIGIGCRFPGGANSPGEFWRMICAGTDAISEIPKDRWNTTAHFDPVPGRADKSISKWGGFIDNIDRFDPAPFGISPREADCMDPQQRLLLEATWHAFEDAGLTLPKLHGSSTGVFVGISTTDYTMLQNSAGERTVADIYAATGSTISIAANRISYCFDLRGPSMAMDTACSSALTACHVACQSLWRGDCTQAVVAGVNAILTFAPYVVFSRMSMLSPEGRCKAFDASANGFVRAEGVGAVVLKPLSAALADGDPIYAVVRSTAANQDGRTNGITVPSPAAQEALVRQACANAGITPAEISYIEAHGTGTPVGDPIETNALGAALSVGRKTPCPIGSVKTNIGHLEAAAGIASLIKVALVLKHRTIPPSLHFKNPNPYIDFEKLKLRVVQQLEKLPAQNGKSLYAGINSFGFGGANAHVILEAPPAPAPRKHSKPAKSPQKALLLPLSGHSPDALRTSATNHREALAAGNIDAHDLCAAAATRRSHLSHRLCVIGDSRQDLDQKLDAFLAGNGDSGIVAGETSGTGDPVFVFSGQGPQWWGMGRELLARAPLFRRKLEECDALFREFGGWSLLEELGRTEKTTRLHETAFAQPAIFALQVALAELWQSWGVKPAAVVGHSVGEVAAAHVGGALTLREAARVIFQRGRCMNAAPNTGRMLAASLDAEAAGHMAAEFPGEVTIAAFNSPNAVTFSGEPGPLEKLAHTLENRGVFNRFLQVNYAFHSHQMDAVKPELLGALGTVETSPAQLPIFSTVTGLAAQGADFSADYWWRNVRKPVRFTQAIAALAGLGHRFFLELSAHPALMVSISETLAQAPAPGKVFCSLRRKEPEQTLMLANLAAMHVAGVPVDWKKFYPGRFADVPLPAFPWQRERHWAETDIMRASRLDSPIHPFLQARLRTAAPGWNTWLDLDALPYLRDHRVGDHIVFPGSGYVEAALAMGTTLFNSRPVEVEDVQFQKALILPDTKDPLHFQSTYSPGDDSVRFSSRATATGDSAEWAVNAIAKLRPLLCPRPEPVDLSSVKTRLPSKLNTDRVYHTYTQRALPYGPAFRGVRSVLFREGESLGEITLPPSIAAGIERYQFHPALLDACFQTCIFSAPESHLHQNTSLLPQRIDRVKFFAPPGRRFYCHTKLVLYSSYAITWDVQILDPAGRVLVVLEGFRTQNIRGVARSSSTSDPTENWLYESQWVETPAVAVSKSKKLKPLTGTWVLLADRSGVAENLAGIIAKQDGHPLLVFAGEKFQRTGPDRFEVPVSSPSDWRRMIDAVNQTNGKSLAGVVHLWNLDNPANSQVDAGTLETSAATGCYSVLHLLQTLLQNNATPPLWIVTRRAQAVQPGEDVALTQSPAIGIGRTMLTELQKWPSRLVDLDTAPAAKNAALLARELAGGDAETEVAFRGQSRFGLRLAHTTLAQHPPRVSEIRNPGYRLTIPDSGVMDELALLETPRRRPAAQEVEIEVCAAALNFRDVMKSLGIYPMDSELDLLLGDECSGRITAVGTGVKQFKVGDEVIASAIGCFASHITVPARVIMRKPARITFEEAATIPVAFMTAWYTLHTLGRIQRGEKILIHAATGGVGLAAIQIARTAGAEIFATAGSDEKRKYLRRLGIRHVMDSRSTAFAGEIRRLTEGAGVDLVLNSLAGDAISKGLSVLAPGGRFLEIGKRDVYANTAIGLRPLRNNVAMYVVDMAQVTFQQPAVLAELMNNILKYFRAGKFQPLPHQALPVTQAANAFRLMAQAKHIGKIVLSMQNVAVTPRRLPPRKPIHFPARASYVITGGLGGFGLAIAQWMVASGARNLILTGRNGAATPAAKRAVAGLKRAGAQVLVVKADVANENDVAQMFKLAARKLPPIRGIFHAAMVLDDGILPQLTPERFTRVMAPKVTGGWNLHRASAHLPLDHFVLFSSVSAIAGAAGQGNYVAANCFLDALAHYRRAAGLPALSVNWGALAEVGFLARNSKVAEHLVAHGVHGIPPAQAVTMLGRLLQSNTPQIGFMHIEWQKYFASLSNAAPPPKFSSLFNASAQAKSADSGEVRGRILSAPADQQLPLAIATVCELAAKVLRTSAAKLDVNRPLKEMGLDSLMAFELLNRLEGQFGVSLPPSRFSANATITHLAAVLLEIMGGAKADSAAAPTAAKSTTSTVGDSGPSATARPEVNDGQLLTLRTSPAARPLIFIHPAGGITNIYDELASQLPAGFPVVAIQSRVLAGAASEWTSLADLVRDYAALINRRFPDGDLRLAGFSVGGMYALAVAAELERLGRNVSFVGLIDSPVSVLDPETPRDVILKNLILELHDYFSTELGLFKPEDPEKFTGSLAELAQKAAAEHNEPARLKMILNWLSEHGLNADDSADSGTQQFFELFNRHAGLVRKFKLKPLQAPVWLGRAGASHLTSLPVAAGLPDRITRGNFVEEIIDGRHFEIMNPPRVVDLAARLAAQLAPAENPRLAQPALAR